MNWKSYAIYAVIAALVAGAWYWTDRPKSKPAVAAVSESEERAKALAAALSQKHTARTDWADSWVSELGDTGFTLTLQESLRANPRILLDATISDVLEVGGSYLVRLDLNDWQLTDVAVDLEASREVALRLVKELEPGDELFVVADVTRVTRPALLARAVGSTEPEIEIDGAEATVLIHGTLIDFTESPSVSVRSLLGD